MAKTIVIGGGIIGLSTAKYLIESGHEVTVLDKHGFIENCSYGNAGYLCPSHFVPLAAPGIIWQGIKWMFDSQSPFYIKPVFSKEIIAWAWYFYKSSTKTNVDLAAIPLRDIALISQAEYTLWATQFNFGLEHKGMIELFNTAGSLKHAQHTVDTATSLGLGSRLLSIDEIKALEPKVDFKVIGGLMFACDSHLNPALLMNQLKSYLTAKGVEMLHDEVIDILPSKLSNTVTTHKGMSLKCDHVVLAGGSWSPTLIHKLKLKIPMMPGKGYSFKINHDQLPINHPIILSEGRIALTPFSDRKVQIGGTMEVAPINDTISHNRVKGIVKNTKIFIPELQLVDPSTDDLWYGYRPLSADGLPYIGRVKNHPRIVIATGHAMVGLSLGAATGKLVSQLVNEDQTDIDLKTFDPNRFN